MILHTLPARSPEDSAARAADAPAASDATAVDARTGDAPAGRGLPCPSLDTALARLLHSARTRPDRLPLTRTPGGAARCADPMLAGMLRCSELAGPVAVLADVDKVYRAVPARFLPVWSGADARAGARLDAELARELARERLDGAAPDAPALVRGFPPPRDVWSFFDPWSCGPRPDAATDYRAGLASAWLWGYVGAGLDSRANAERFGIVAAIGSRAGLSGDARTVAHALAAVMRDGTPGPARDALVWGWKTYGERDGRALVATVEREEDAAPLVG